MRSPGERLSRLASAVGGRVTGGGDPMVVDVTHDSRRVEPGWLFVAIRGARADGHAFVSEAVAAGAAAVCVEREVAVDVPMLVVGDTRAALPHLAATVHANPAAELDLVGVTGTNGKTTVTYMVEAIGRAAGRKTGLIGTIETRIGGEVVPAVRTTPEASDLQRLLRSMRNQGVDLVAAEVSSHALELGRVTAVDFAVAAFTNLSPEHLDFHGDMENYYRAKRRLFGQTSKSVVWIDDPYGRRLADEVTALKVGWSREADVTGELLVATPTSTRLAIAFPDGARVGVDLPLPGRFNAANALVAAACGYVLGIPPERVARGLSSMGAVPGRFEVVGRDHPVSVVVDYAHSPAAIQEVISTARRLTRGKVVVVFGAGGDRDRAKRPLMGKAAAAADAVVVTSDNPRSEDPEEIMRQVVAGIPPGTVLIEEPDRRKAIRSALELVRPGDMVLILGKGHEQGQEIGGRVVPFDDRQVAAEELRRMGP